MIDESFSTCYTIHAASTTMGRKYTTNFSFTNVSYLEVMNSNVQDLMLRLSSTRTSASPSGMSAVRTKSGMKHRDIYIFSRKYFLPFSCFRKNILTWMLLSYFSRERNNCDHRPEINTIFRFSVIFLDMDPILQWKKK